MTRKDYVALAKAINTIRKTSYLAGKTDFIAGVDQVTGAIAQVLQEDNPRFDKERFYKAVDA